ncbi:uncharacterized protein LACBIDRAFT_311662 [Laccaria bicolor S238N-H82]|uniref:Predicted protein n=1 Tax=Laccaria bicolor (strain S238N-H82 / ATCC MYA-4686) TaxID=486041 RepID=B0CXY8_LACBS|nr:uncharacterized protein LACBIDRAFT_311662 [Laccaria bicolor S238N-H82]EDR12800.1 predicted protein [Laccaria bicolor S238N-H82]|eukprot:XP_001877064.1 predicted protein [Laccaria bicolor S238N-H82]
MAPSNGPTCFSMVASVRCVKDSTFVVAGRSDDRRTDLARSNARAVDKQKSLGHLSAVHAVGIDNGCKYLPRCGDGDRLSFPGSYGQCM